MFFNFILFWVQLLLYLYLDVSLLCLKRGFNFENEHCHTADPFHSLDNLENLIVFFGSSSRVWSGRNGAVTEWSIATNITV